VRDHQKTFAEDFINAEFASFFSLELLNFLLCSCSK